MIQLSLIVLGGAVGLLTTLAWKYIDGLALLEKKEMTPEEYVRATRAIICVSVLALSGLITFAVMAVTKALSPIYSDKSRPVFDVKYSTADGQGEQDFYQLLAERIGRAKNTVLTVSLPRKGSLPASEHRASYYRMLDEKLEKLARKGRKFDFARIVQVDSPGSVIDPRELDQLILKSCTTLLAHSGPGPTNYDLLSLKSGSVSTSFFIIDSEEVILLAPKLTGDLLTQNKDDESFMGFAVHISRDDQLVQSFIQLFTRLRQKAVPVEKLAEGGHAELTQLGRRTVDRVDDSIFELNRLLTEYNKEQSAAYNRGKWRDLTALDVERHPAPGRHIVKWSRARGSASAKNDFVEPLLSIFEAARAAQERPTVLLPADHSVSDIVSCLLAEELVIIPNGHIYVIFGIATEKVKRKINMVKLRDPQQDLVYLGYESDELLTQIASVPLRNFVQELLDGERPIGFRIPENGDPRGRIVVFYDDEFVEKIQKSLIAMKPDAKLYVSSANLTTMGSSADFDTVLRDFSDVVKIFVEGQSLDLQKNKSSTILDLTDKISAKYYRIGFPSEDTIGAIARKHSVSVKPTKLTRSSISQA